MRTKAFSKAVVGPQRAMPGKGEGGFRGERPLLVVLAAPSMPLISLPFLKRIFTDRGDR